MNVCTQSVTRSVTGLLAGVALGWLPPGAAAGGLQPHGAEFPLTRGIPGDQVNPSVVFRTGGGWIVWQDAAIDGDGQGISALRLGADGSSAGSPRRVNDVGGGDQENPSILIMADGRLFCAWQGGQLGFQRIFARILNADGTAIGPDLAVSNGDGEHQIDPVAARLADGSVVVAYASYRQDGSSAYDVYARRISATGALLGPEFSVNGSRGMNRRSPALAPLASGGFLAAWISERQVGVRDNADARGRALAGFGAPVFAAQVVSRAFDSEGLPATGEAVVSESGLAANPILCALGDGRVYSAWTRRNPSQSRSRFDVYGRMLDGFGSGLGSEKLLNVQTVGDQYRPRLAVTRHGLIAVWTSMGQDGSWEGVFGRWIDPAGEPSGDEVAINGERGGGQLFPAVATTPESDLLVAYSSNQPRTGHEIFAQRLVPLRLRVEAGTAGSLSLRWPTVVGAVYQLQSSADAKAWKSIGSPRTASGESDELAISAPGEMVLYRIVRVR